MSKTVVVTGAAGALGSAVVRHLAGEGHKVLALDTPRAQERLAALENELKGACFGHAMDVGSATEWAEVVSRLEKEIAPPDGAVLIAGGWQGGTPFHAEANDTTWRAMMAMNLDTAEHSLRALLPGMVTRKRGSVVVIGSRAAVLPATSGGASAYAASKAALVALSQVIAAEVLEHGVRVNAVLPSALDTPANRAAMPSADPSRWVATDSLAQVIAFLLSDASRDISGAAIPVYGRS